MDHKNSTDQDLVAAALKDRHAFAALVERYESPLARYVRRLGADIELTKDVLQESFIKAYVNLNDYDSSLSFSAWIYRIVHNETVSQFRKQRVRPITLERKEDLALFDKIPDELNLLTEADARLTQAAVQDALKVLENNYRDILILRFFEEKSYDEISDILKIPAGTVATHLNRGKAKLKEILKKNQTIGV